MTTNNPESVATIPVQQKAPKGKRGSGSAHDLATSPADTMSQCVALCQEQRWREAVLLLRKMRSKARQDGNKDLYNSLGRALVKLEYSLRRQMAAALVHAAGGVLAKEFLVDVGEQ